MFKEKFYFTLELFMNMKRSLLAASISLAVSADMAHAEGPIDGKVYGKANVSLQSIDEGTSNRLTELKSNASRLGFKGKTDLDGAFSVFISMNMK